MAPVTFDQATTLLHRAAVSTLFRRQVIVTDNNPNSSGETEKPTDAKTLSGGAIAGIVIGSIAGLLLLIWIFRSCSNLGAPPNAPPNPGGRAWYDGVGGTREPAHSHSRSRSREPRRLHSRRSAHHHHHRSTSRGYRGEEVREVRPVAVVQTRGHSPYRYEERRSRSHSRGHSRGHARY